MSGSYSRRDAYAQVIVEPLAVSFSPMLAEAMLDETVTPVVFERVDDLRSAFARETGIVLPAVHFREDARLAEYEYAIYVREACVGTGRLRVDGLLVIADDETLCGFDGEDTREPVYGLAAKWIATQDASRARAIGAMVFDPLSIVVSHVGQIAREHLVTLFGRQECDDLIEFLRTAQPALMRHVGTDVLPITLFYDTWRMLLRERAWPSDPVAVIECMLDELEMHKAALLYMQRSNGPDRTTAHYQELVDVLYDPVKLTEAVRKKIVPVALRAQTAKSKQPLRYATLSLELMKRITISWQREGWSFRDMPDVEHLFARVDGERCEKWLHGIRCAPEERVMVSAFLRYAGCRLPVYAADEVPADIATVHHAIIGESELQDTNAMPAFPV